MIREKLIDKGVGDNNKFRGKMRKQIEERIGFNERSLLKSD